MTKIYIIGAPGSGKTTYARKLSQELGVPHFDLDELKWENTGGKYYSKKRDKIERAKMLDDVLAKNPHWICEGVYFRDWILPVIQNADEVIVLMPPRWLRQCRILRRSIRRMLHLEPSKHKETSKSLYDLLSWAHRYDYAYLPLALEEMRAAKTPYRIIKK